MLAACTPKRWELIAALRQAGPLNVPPHLGRVYKNIHTDVNRLIEWMALERYETAGAGGGVKVLTKRSAPIEVIMNIHPIHTKTDY